ncbi:MAG: helix-turn-helix transcriptional regulator [Ruminococcus sp.]|nr:helix-turn-helix transcriptional regulator [Ruminococcus sp.]
MSKSKPISYKNINKYTEMGLNISYYRKKKGLTQEQLAEKIGISRSHLSAIEAPNIVKSFSIELLFDIANALDIEVYKLLVFRD